MLPEVEALIMSLVPLLISQVDSLVGVKPDEQHQWIVGLVNEVVSLLDSRLPAWIRPSEAALEALVEDALAKLL